MLANTTITLSFSHNEMIDFLLRVGCYKINREQRQFVMHEGYGKTINTEHQVVIIRQLDEEHGYQELTVQDETSYIDKSSILKTEFAKEFKKHLLKTC